MWGTIYKYGKQSLFKKSSLTMQPTPKLPIHIRCNFMINKYTIMDVIELLFSTFLNASLLITVITHYYSCLRHLHLLNYDFTEKGIMKMIEPSGRIMR